MNDTTLRSVRDAGNTLRGRLFGAIEAAGLPDRQEDAIKNLIRSATYEAQSTIEAAVRENGHG